MRFHRKVYLYFFLIVIILSCFIILFWKFVIQPQQTTADFQINYNNLDITYGMDQAPLVIVVYSRYDCVFCRKFFNEVLPLVKKDYIDIGKVKFVVKLIDFSNDPSIKNAYKTAVCINHFGNFEKLNQLLLTEPDVVYSKQFLDITEGFIEKDQNIAECMLGGDADDYLKGNYNEFVRLQLTGTPTFIINNKIYKGYKTYPVLKKVIEKELKRAL